MDSTGTDGKGAVVKGIWREIAIGLLTFSLTLAGSIFVLTKDTINRQDMIEYVEKNGPWPRDRAMVMGLLTTEKSRRDQYEGKIERLTESVIRLEGSMDRHSEILKAIEDRMRRREEKERGTDSDVNARSWFWPECWRAK